MVLRKISRFPSEFFSSCIFSHNRLYKTVSKLISCYFKSGRTKDAEKLFDKIPEKNVVSWSVLIHGFAINGLHRDSLESFFRMRIAGLAPNSFTFVGVLVGVQCMQDSVKVRYFHGLVVKSGFEADPVVGTALFDAYAKCRNVWDSYKLFQGMKNRCAVSCNAMISGFVRNEMFEEGVLMFNRFRRDGLVPNVSMMLSVIQGCNGLGTKVVCESVHGILLRSGFVSDLHLNNALLGMYSCLMDLDSALAVFDMMKHKDVITWTVMIGLLVNFEYASDAVHLFTQMRANGVILDSLLVVNVISACGVLGDLKRGREIHAQSIVSGFESDIPLGNSLIAMYSKCGNLSCSSAVFLHMKQKSLVSWTAMMSGFLENGQSREALDLFMNARSTSPSLDSVMMVNGITASGEVCAFELCLQLHCFSFQMGFSNYRQIQNSLISAYSKCCSMNFAYKVFVEMGSSRNTISWNTIINGYGINSQGETSLTLLYEMRNVGENADSATYLCVLSACSHAGLVEEGLLIFQEMLENNRVIPTEEHYGCVIDMLARSGCLSEARGFIQKSLHRLGSNALRYLLSGCVLHGNTELAEIVAKKLFEIEPAESSQVVLLSNIYSSMGRFMDAEKLRSSIQKKGLRKTPGFSFAGDGSSHFG